MAPGNQSRAKYDTNGKKVKSGREPNEDDRQGLERMRPYEAFVWSSAQPENVWSMVDRAFEKHADLISPNKEKRRIAAKKIRNVPLGDRPGRLLGVWDRKSLGLSIEDFARKSRTSKDLRKILDAFAETDSALPCPDPSFVPQIFNTLLLDDSTGKDMKSGSQPWNHVPLPPYEIDHKERDMEFIRDYAQAQKVDLDGIDRRFDDSIGDLQADLRARVAVLSAMFGSDPLQFYDNVKAGQLVETNIDAALLAVIGILAEMSDVMIVPAWIAAGGLMPNIESSFTREDAAKGWETLIANDLSLPALSANETSRAEDEARLWRRNVLVNALDIPELSPAKHMVPQFPPSYPEYKHWFESPFHVLYWVRRGMIALDERGVPIIHGIVPTAKLNPSSPRSSPARQSDRMSDRRAPARGPYNDTQDWRRGGTGSDRARHDRYDYNDSPGRNVGPSSGPGRELDRNRPWSEQQVRYEDRDGRERNLSDLYPPDSRRGPRERPTGPRDDRSRSPVRGRTDSRAYGRRDVRRDDEHPRHRRWESRSMSNKSYSPGRSMSLSMSPTSREYAMLYAPATEKNRSREASDGSYRRRLSRSRSRSRNRMPGRAVGRSRSRSRGRPRDTSRERYLPRSRSGQRYRLRSRSGDEWRRGRGQSRAPSPRRYCEDDFEGPPYFHERGREARRYSPSHPLHR